MLDNKFKSLEALVHEFQYSSYPKQIVIKALTMIEQYGIRYVLDELPDNESVSFYNKHLDEYIMKKIIKEKK